MSIKSVVRVFFHGLLVLVAFIVSSCTSDGLTEETAGQEATATLRLTFKVADDAVTRALSDNENTVNNVMILIFDSNEQLIGSKYVYGLSTTTSTTATVTTRVAAGCTVYAIANTGSASYFSGINTIENLNAKSTSIIGAAALGDGNNVLMAGSASVDITAGTNSISVPIKHLCSKVNISIVPSSGITVTGYQLCHTSLGCYITDSHSSSGTAVMAPANGSGNSYGDFDAVTLASPTAGTTVTLPVYYVYENLAGSNSSCTTEQLRTEANAPAHAMYLEVYAKTSSWHSVYRIYLGGMTNASTPVMDLSNFNVYRNMNYTYTVNITGSGQSDARVTYTSDKIRNTVIGTATIGDYLYADGTEGTTYQSGQTVGIIYSNELTPEQYSAGCTHGKVLALNNANSGSTCKWSSSNSTTTYPTKPYVTNFTKCYQDVSSGYYGTCTQSPSLAESSSNYAWYYCRQYSDGVTKTFTNSGWYLPGAGDWWDIMANLGDGLSSSLASLQTSTTGAGNYLLSGLNANTYLNTLNSKLTNAGGTAFGYSSGAYYYWSSSEYSSNRAVSFGFGASVVSVGGNLKTSYSNYVRAVLAF